MYKNMKYSIHHIRLEKKTLRNRKPKRTYNYRGQVKDIDSYDFAYVKEKYERTYGKLKCVYDSRFITIYENIKVTIIILLNVL